MADKTKHKIRNLFQKFNDEDRNTFCCLLIKAGYAANADRNSTFPGLNGKRIRNWVIQKGEM